MKGLLRARDLCNESRCGRRLGAIALLVFAALTVTAGCSKNVDQQAPRHVTYWEKWNGFESEAMDAVVADFNALEAAHAQRDPHYAPIEVEKVTVSKIEQKLLIA
ncbi:MAG TPA: hypothetical protein VHM25_09715, partial [Polyangiaceae bacterium]|nr:hypothetical protein [Polyangiaceae bacterium]